MTAQSITETTRAKKGKLGVGGRLYLAFALIATLAILSGGVAITTFLQLGDAMSGITEKRFPSLISTLTLSRENERFLAGLRPLATAGTEADRAQANELVAQRLTSLRQQYEDLESRGLDDEHRTSLLEGINLFQQRVENLNSLVAKRLSGEGAFNAGLTQGRETLSAQQAQLEQALRNSSGEQAPALADLIGKLAAIGGLLQEVAVETDTSMLDLWSMRYMAGGMEMEASLAMLDTGLQDRLRSGLSALSGLSDPENGLASQRKSALETRQAITNLLALCEEQAAGLAAQLDQLVNHASAQVVHARQSTQNLQETSTFVVAAAALSVFLAALLLGWFYVKRNLLNRLENLHGGMVELAKGNLEIEVRKSGRDEITSMADAVQVFQQNAQEKLRLEARESARKEQALEKRKNDLLSLAGQIEEQAQQAVRDVSDVSQSMVEITGNMETSAVDLRDRSQETAQTSQEVSGNVATVAGAAEELASSISEISEQIGRAASHSESTMRQARSASSAIEQLNQKANRINDAVSMISDIAEQTNLLALNATIESARAGDAGKGFAVVASEVRSLADQTAKVTQEISQQISDIQSETRDMVKEINRMSESAEQMNEISTNVAAAVEQQGSATAEISNAAQNAADHTKQVSGNMETVAEQSSQTDRLAGQVSSLVGTASDNIRSLEKNLAGIVADLRRSATDQPVPAGD